ncbi:hypothetical protein AB2M95_24490 [Pseudomonas chlororaphis]|uniref:hypothetical protein n=1 Tax=Pseudomonas chlororaphis TaxID=587753 RepID=UPI003462D2BC
MNDLEVVKGFLIQLIQDKKGDFESGEWEADYDLNWGSEFSERIDRGFYNVAKAIAARKSKDDVMLKVALLNARVDFMDLANFFRDIYDDIDALLKDTSWPEVPEGFDYEQEIK